MEDTNDLDLIELFGYTKFVRGERVCSCCLYPYCGVLFNHSVDCSYMWDVYRLVKYAYENHVSS